MSETQSQTEEGERTRLMHDDRQSLTEGTQATLMYRNRYTNSVVEKQVTITDTIGRVMVELEDGTEWCVFETSIRTTVNKRRQSGTVDAKNGLRLGSLVSLEQNRVQDNQEDDQ